MKGIIRITRTKYGVEIGIIQEDWMVKPDKSKPYQIKVILSGENVPFSDVYTSWQAWEQYREQAQEFAVNMAKQMGYTEFKVIEDKK